MRPALQHLLEWTARKKPGVVNKRLRFKFLYERFFPDLLPFNGVKVAGTNGKGSVCRLLEAGIEACGKKTGIFTSPHLSRVTERIRIGGQEVESDLLEQEAETLGKELELLILEVGDDYLPSFFEVLLILALRLFIKAEVEVAVLEAGDRRVFHGGFAVAVYCFLYYLHW